MTTDVSVAAVDISERKSTNSSFYWFSCLLLRIVTVSLLVGLSVVGLVVYFWGLPVLFEQDDLFLFLTCFFVVQMLWHYFSLFEWQSEGVVRSRQSILMFLCPNRLIITGLTIILAVIVFYWNFLFLPEQNAFIAAVFFIIFLPQLFVRIWDLIVQKDSSILAGCVALLLLMLIVAEEIRYGIGFRYLTAQVEKVAKLESKPGQSQSWDIPIPDSPRWKREGIAYYSQLFTALNNAGFRVDKDTHLVLTPQAKKLMDMGIVPYNHYQGRAFSGIRISDRHKKTVYQYEHPNQFKNFAHISPFILKALLVWENDKLRHLLFPPEKKNHEEQKNNDEGIELNYLIEGPRIVKSLAEYLHYKITGEGAYSGGSTLMTTLEKITNTPGGRTQNINDKIKQMIGAGLHLYADNSNTGVKKALVDFLNTVPMAGGPKSYTGELYGFGASYYAWFGYTIDELNEQLKSKDRAIRVQAFKNICAIIVSIRRPSELLLEPERIERQANVLLRRLKQKKLLNSALYIKARALKPAWNSQSNGRVQPDYSVHREAFSVRNQYTQMVRQAVAKKSGIEKARRVNLQTVDSMPVAIELNTDARLEQSIHKVLDEMYSEVAQQSPFVQSNQKGLLNDLTLDELEQIKYGVMVLEIDKNRQWKILANTDTQSKVVYNPAKQGRFQWGSTAKLRVLVNYLMIIHDEARLLQSELGQGNAERLLQYKKSSVKIKRLLATYISRHPEADMDKILNLAMSRRISAAPGEKFLTGESWHQFHNYQKSDDRKNPNLWQMTTQSINLAFVRLMRDVVDYYIDQLGYDKVAILKDRHNLVRKRIIDDAVKQDEAVYLEGMNFFVAQIQKHFLSTSLRSAGNEQERVREPGSDKEITDKEIIGKAREIARNIKNSSSREVKKYRRLASLLKRITYYEKPWLLARVRNYDSTTPASVVAQERRILQQTSRWLRTNKFWIKNTLYTYLEQQAFAKGVTSAWKKLGYPFNVSPSYAVVLGSSGDTPMSLLELTGTLLNEGMQEKNITAIERIVLAPGSEFETTFKAQHQQEAIIPKEVAMIARKAMEGVLQKGTAIFASRHPLMQFVQSAGAKTGTGDNRHNQKSVNRSAAVLSILDNGKGKAKYAVCITMSVVKGDIQRYKFTSKIPVRILSRIADHLTPIIANKSIQELQIELAAKQARESKQHNLALVSASASDSRLQYKNSHKSKTVDKPAEDSLQLYENLF